MAWRNQAIVLAAAVATGTLWSASAPAALVTTRVDTNADGATVDGSLGANEYDTGNAYSYGGAGTSFGGPVGNGTLYMESDGTNLYIGLNVAGDIGSNLINVYLNTKTGGFTDATMTDNADGGRHNVSDLTRDSVDNFPTGFLADYALQFGNGFTNFFELTGTSHNFIAPTAAGTGGQGGAGVREASIPLATLGVAAGGNVDFLVTYISDSRFTSDEGIPGQPFSGSGNVGFGSAETTVNWDNFDRFTTVPEPASLGVLVIVGAALRRSRRGC